MRPTETSFNFKLSSDQPTWPFPESSGSKRGEFSQPSEAHCRKISARLPWPDYRWLGLELEKGVGSFRVAITFDDGYADIFQNALPVLEEFNFPATIFITTSMLDSPGEFWWDELEDIIFEKSKKNKEFKIKIKTENLTWKTGNEAQVSKFYSEIVSILRNSEQDVRRMIIDAIRAWAGVEPGRREDYRAITVDELRKLALHPLMEIGSHTLTHPNLGQISKKAQEHELRELRRRFSTRFYPSPCKPWPIRSEIRAILIARLWKLPANVAIA